MSSNLTRFTRRSVMAMAAALAALPFLPGEAHALTVAEARGLIDRVVADVNSVINSGRSEAQMISDFESILARYADVPIIAQSVLGPPARSASRAQLNTFTEAFQGYLSRKYGRRFREFIGGEIIVTEGRAVQSFFEVISTVNLRGEAPFELRWLVSDRSGQDRFFNLIIEGVNLMVTERTEIGAMLDRRNGDIDALTADLRNAG